ncbi:MAG: rhodanese-like domain-containing protein, partial [Desulfobacteraceae bacterium]|nr:rhodanese-like domain-containing protein [Desulfobacteraceae bacterium]
LKHEAESVIIIDARPSEFFRQKHIKRAVNLPPALFDFVYMMRFNNLDPQKELIVYGRNISRHYDEEVVFKLVSRGHKNVKVLAGGLPAWEKAGYPIEK